MLDCLGLWAPFLAEIEKGTEPGQRGSPGAVDFLLLLRRLLKAACANSHINVLRQCAGGFRYARRSCENLPMPLANPAAPAPVFSCGTVWGPVFLH